MRLRVAFAAALLAAATLVPSSALAQTPTQTINAETNPTGAAAALNSGCANNIGNCKLADISITNGYDAPQILGDVLYNCAPVGGLDAYTATSISDTRGETTSVSESISLKLQGGLIGIASASTEFKAFSSQSESVSTSVTTGTQIPVPPGYKGYTTTQVPSGKASVDYYVTDGINLIKVTNVDLSFPGFGDATHAHPIYNTITAAINPVFPLHYPGMAPCNAVTVPPDTSVVGGGLGGARPNRGPSHFKVVVCSSGARCATRSIPGPPPGKPARATVTLTRHGRTYATGTDRRGHIRLRMRRKATAGRYLLKIEQTPKLFHEKRYGGRLAEQRVAIHIPVNVCGNSPSSGGLNPVFGNSCANDRTS